MSERPKDLTVEVMSVENGWIVRCTGQGRNYRGDSIGAIWVASTSLELATLLQRLADQGQEAAAPPRVDRG